MRFIHYMLLVCTTTLTLGGRLAAQVPGPAQDLSAQVRSIFLAKCSECHGRSLSRPRAALYLHELGQVASNREWVVPFEPEKSYLWTLLRNDDMPAKGAKAGPLDPREKELVRAWIAAGAPVTPSHASPAPFISPPDKGDEVAPSSAPSTQSLLARILAWLGRFHILVIHFPIALLATAALVEMIAALRGSRGAESTVRICVLFGTAGAVAAVALGWLHADYGAYGSSSSDTLRLHRWLGTSAGLWSIAMAVLSERDSRRGERSMLFRVLLWIGAILVAIAAHFGGQLVHGSNFFDWR
jgi:uncharacterized membrane protein/mono/diheme cytochrome c family protein